MFESAIKSSPINCGSRLSFRVVFLLLGWQVMIRAIQGTSSISFWGELGNWNILRISLTHIALSGFSRLPLSLLQILPLFWHLSFLQGVTNRLDLHWCFVCLAPPSPFGSLHIVGNHSQKAHTHKQKVKIQPRSRLAYMQVSTKVQNLVIS